MVVCTHSLVLLSAEITRQLGVCVCVCERVDGDEVGSVQPSYKSSGGTV